MTARIPRRIVLALAVLAFAHVDCVPPVPKPARLVPKRLYSIGDSITRAFDAWFVADNLPVSWSNGYHGFFEDLIGVPDVNSHNQRITARYGSSGRRNVIEAENGADWGDALDQAQGVVGEQPNYVTIMLGGNDVCQDEIDDLPTDAEIRGQVRGTLDFLDQNLPAGATVLVIGIPDVKRLYDVALAEKGVFGIDCEAIWETTAIGFPCGSMLSPDNSEADRLFVQSRNFAYNQVIALEVARSQANSTRVHYSFMDAQSVPFTGDEISSIDCFHPSDEGEELISALSWSQGPFAP
jgi:lysophospholipase L1-like esterase